MRIRVMSDLHFETHRDRGVNFAEQEYTDNVDVAIIAGDLSDFENLHFSLEQLCRAYSNSLVLFVPGNHEFYKASFEQTLNLLMEFSVRCSNFKCLYNDRLVYQGIKFFGTTLWFKYTSGLEDLYSKVADFHLIANFEEQVYMQNQMALEFIARGDLANGIVITHMLPSLKSVHPKFEGSKLTPFFVCEVDDLIIEKSPKCWIHGHIHKNVDYLLGKTRVICNPMGAVFRDQNLDYNYNFILKV